MCATLLYLFVVNTLDVVVVVIIYLHTLAALGAELSIFFAVSCCAF